MKLQIHYISSLGIFFCDWYIELSKTILSEPSHDDKIETQNVASYVLNNIMIMLHPIMPFITEHLWKEIDFINQNNSKNHSFRVA